MRPERGTEKKIVDLVSAIFLVMNRFRNSDSTESACAKSSSALL